MQARSASVGGALAATDILVQVSFGAANRSGETVQVDADFAERHISDLAANADLSRFVLLDAIPFGSGR
jgi:ATP-dependent protease HslVU (ClpYQ) ATPase subunit